MSHEISIDSGPSAGSFTVGFPGMNLPANHPITHVSTAMAHTEATIAIALCFCHSIVHRPSDSLFA